MCCLTWKRELCRCDEVNGEITLDYPAGPLLEGGLESERNRDWKMLHALKLGRGPLVKEFKQSEEITKRLGNGSPLELPKGTQPHQPMH